MRLGELSVVVAYRGRWGGKQVADDLGLDAGTRPLIAGSEKQPGPCRSLSLIDWERRPVDAVRRSAQEKSSSVSIVSRRQSRYQGDG